MGIFDWKHWVIILGVVVIVFGTKKLKSVGTDLGESIKGFRNAMNEDAYPASEDPQQAKLGQTVHSESRGSAIEDQAR